MILVEDRLLVERFKGGDEVAFNQLVERHKREIYSLAYQLTGDPEEAFDLSQRVFLRCHQAREGLPSESPFRTALHRLLVELSPGGLQAARTEPRPAPRGGEPAGPAGAPVEEEPEGETEARRRQRAAELRQAIGGLPPGQKQALVLKIYGEMRYEDIAGVLRCPPATAKARFFQAVQALLRTAGGESPGDLPGQRGDGPGEPGR